MEIHMALAKIKEVYLYTGYASRDDLENDKIKKYLDKAKIKYTLLNYGDPEQFPAVIEPLNTWKFENFTGKLTSLPIVIWKTFDTDFNMALECVTNLEALKVSTLAKNPDKVG